MRDRRPRSGVEFRVKAQLNKVPSSRKPADSSDSKDHQIIRLVGCGVFLTFCGLCFVNRRGICPSFQLYLYNETNARLRELYFWSQRKTNIYKRLGMSSRRLFYFVNRLEQQCLDLRYPYCITFLIISDKKNCLH